MSVNIDVRCYHSGTLTAYNRLTCAIRCFVRQPLPLQIALEPLLLHNGSLLASLAFNTNTVLFPFTARS